MTANGESDNQMMEAYELARWFAAILGGISLLGATWFAGARTTSLVIVSGTVIGVCSVVAAFISPRKLSLSPWRHALTILGILGVIAGLVLLANDLQSKRLEWDVLILRGAHVAALVLMTLAALTHKSRSVG